MCSGGGGSPTYEVVQAPKQPPTPTPVTSADVEADKGIAEKKKPKSSQGRNFLSKDRTTILGSMLDSGNDKLG